MKLIDRLLNKAISTSTAVIETANGTVELGYQLARLAKAVAHIALVVDNHAKVLRELQEFHKRLAEGLESGDLSVVPVEEQQLDADAKKRLN